MKAIDQSFPVGFESVDKILKILYEVVLTFESANEILTIEMKTTEQCFPMMLFIMLYKVVL